MNKAWVRLPLELLRGDLSKAACTVAAILIDRAEDGYAVEISQAALAAAAGLSQRSVRRALADLEAAGLVVQQHTGRASCFTLAEILPPKQRRSSSQQRAAAQSGSSYDLSELYELKNRGLS